MKTLAQRLEAKTLKLPTGCWQFLGGKDSDGYGRIGKTIAGKPCKLLVHRVAYELATGTTIPAGLTIDHLCRNTSCVNPAHMEVVTNGENNRRGDSLSAQNIRKASCPNGHPYDMVDTEGHRRCGPCMKAGQNKQKREKYWRKKLGVIA